MPGGALDGVLVVDLSTLLPGPLATQMMADAGAEVIKVERPAGGDVMRGYDPQFGSASANFAMVNRGKRSLAVDLKDPAGVRSLVELLERCDVVVEQFRPGVMQRLGLDHESVAAINPRVVYCSITGFGQTGPRAGLAAHDLNYAAESGLLDLVGDVAPVLPHGLLADVGGGAYPALVNILMALRQRETTGVGCHLDIAMADNIYPFFYWAWAEAFGGDRWPERGSGLLTGGSPRYQLYGTADGRHLAVAALEEKFWLTLTDRIGLDPRWRDDAADPVATLREMRALLATRTAAEWEQLLAGADVCTTVVRTFDEAIGAARARSADFLDHVASEPGGGRSLPTLPVPVCPPVRASGVSSEYPELGEFGR